MMSIFDLLRNYIDSDDASTDGLAALNWSSMGSSEVKSLLNIMESSNIKAPPPLIEKIVASGHSVDSDKIADPFVHAVNSLNHKSSGSVESNEKADAAIQTLLHSVAPSLGILERALHALDKLKNDDGLCRIALKHYLKYPEMVKRYTNKISNFSDSLPEKSMKLLGFSTLNHFEKDLKITMLDFGLSTKFDYPGYGQVIQQLMMPLEEKIRAVNIILDTRSIHNPDWRLSTEENHKRSAAQFDDFLNAIQVCIDQNGVSVVANSLLPLQTPSFGFVDHLIEGSEANIVHDFNRKLIALANRNKNFILIDTENALAEVAPTRRASPKLEYYGKFAFSGEASRHLAKAFASFHAVSTGQLAKVLVLDLDNTVWGGVYGADGVENLKIGDTFPGNAFQQFQQECLRLKQQGFLLTVLSKNNADAISVFTDHPEMILAESDIVASRINWMPKHENIMELAKELNLGLDSFIFLDDSPYERSAMRTFAPEVTTPELPEDVAERPNFLRALSKTWIIRLTDEDRERSNLYIAEKQRSQTLQTAPSLEAYITGLEQKINISPVDASSLSRAAQLHMRTNQFNLTTERYDERSLTEMINDPAGNIVLAASVSDRYGDHGIVLATTISIQIAEAEIKSLVMSCRVFGRGVEEAYLAAILRYLNSIGITKVRGSYKPTKKNAIVKEFFPSNGFKQISKDDRGNCSFVLDLGSKDEYPISSPIEIDFNVDQFRASAK